VLVKLGFNVKLKTRINGCVTELNLEVLQGSFLCSHMDSLKSIGVLMVSCL